MTTVLIVEDDQEIGDLILLYLGNAQIGAQACLSAEAALLILSQQAVPLILLDLNLPGMDGFSFLRKIREKYDTRVIVVSALESDEDKINALGLGADDFVTKPFSPKVLVARVQAQLRRTANVMIPAPSPITFGPFVLDFLKCTLEKDGKRIALRKKEWDLLVFLVQNPEQAFKPDKIFHEVWGNDFGELTTVAVHIQRLRRKMGEDPSSPEFIKTQIGFGYQFCPEESPS